MKFVLIFGPGAVGKMTVGQELEKLTGLRLFHNHMTIDLVANFFSYGSPEGRRLVDLFRKEIFEAVAKSDLPGMIFTVIFSLDSQSDWDYIEDLCKVFERAEICFVELEADFEERHRRNTTPNRLAHKPTKRNLEMAEKWFMDGEKKWRANSRPGEITHENYIRIDTTNIEPQDAAKLIKDAFAL